MTDDKKLPFDDPRWLYNLGRSLRPISVAAIVQDTGGPGPRESLRNLRDADPDGYANLTEHLDVPERWLP